MDKFIPALEVGILQLSGRGSFISASFSVQKRHVVVCSGNKTTLPHSWSNFLFQSELYMYSVYISLFIWRNSAPAVPQGLLTRLQNILCISPFSSHRQTQSAKCECSSNLIMLQMLLLAL